MTRLEQRLAKRDANERNHLMTSSKEELVAMIMNERKDRSKLLREVSILIGDIRQAKIDIEKGIHKFEEA